MDKRKINDWLVGFIGFLFIATILTAVIGYHVARYGICKSQGLSTAFCLTH